MCDFKLKSKFIAIKELNGFFDGYKLNRINYDHISYNYNYSEIYFEKYIKTINYSDFKTILSFLYFIDHFKISNDNRYNPQNITIESTDLKDNDVFIKFDESAKKENINLTSLKTTILYIMTKPWFIEAMEYLSNRGLISIFVKKVVFAKYNLKEGICVNDYYNLCSKYNNFNSKTSKIIKQNEYLNNNNSEYKKFKTILNE